MWIDGRRDGEPRPMPMASRMMRRQSRRGARLVIAIVSQDPVVTQIVPVVAEAGGGTVISFQSLERAREILQTLRLAMRVVIVDVGALQPHVDGSLRTIEELDLPLLVVSVASRRDLMRRGVHIGDRTFQTVPCSAPQIAERLDHAVRRQSTIERLRRERRGVSQSSILV
jgi:DNA-binding response OmpR family regulator